MSAELSFRCFMSARSLVLAEPELVVLEPGLGEDLAQDREALVEILREEVERDGSAVVAVAAVELGGEKREALLEILGLAVLRSAAREEVAGRFREAFLAGRIQVGPAPEDDLDVDERKLVVLREVRDDAGLQDDAMVLRGGRRRRRTA